MNELSEIDVSRLNAILNSCVCLDHVIQDRTILYINKYIKGTSYNTIIRDLAGTTTNRATTQIDMLYLLINMKHILYNGIDIKNMTISEVFKLERRFKLNTLIANI